MNTSQVTTATGRGVSLGVRGLTVKVGERVLLENAAADFRAGEVTLIVGRSGVGKSVLLRILAGLADLSPAGVRHDGDFHFRRGDPTEVVRESPDPAVVRESPDPTPQGAVVRGSPDHSPQGVDPDPSLRGDPSEVPVRPRVGVVFQSFAIFDELSPVGNVNFARDHRDRGHTAAPTSEELLDELRVPHDVPSARLSGGQRQRLAIARTLAYDPEIVLYDEPTSGLDPATAGEVAALIATTYAAHAKTSVIVTHDFESLCSIAHRVYLLDPASRQLREIDRADWPRLSEWFQPAPGVRESSGGEANAAAPASKSHASGPGRVLAWLAAGARGAGAMLGRGLETTSRAAEETLLLPVRLVPLWRSRRWGLRFFLHYLWLVAGPSAWIYMALAGAIIGFVTTYFTFRFLPYARYTEPLLSDDLLASIGFALYRVLVPVLATVLIAARNGAALASDIGGKRYGNQIDALQTFGARPTRYLLTGMLYAMLIGTPLLEWAAYAVASATSLLVFTFTHPSYGPEYWRLHFHRELVRPAGWFFAGSGWLLAKTLACAAGVTLVAFFQGFRPKSSTHDVSRGITTTILWATLYVLIVHFIFSFIEFE